MKKNNVLLLLSSLSLIVILLGATFSYFSVTARANQSQLGVTAAQIGISVDITPLYSRKDLIPMDDADVMKGYQNECVDKNQFGACQVYEIKITNIGDVSGYTGSINFTISDILHLKYMLLDENDNVYVDKTEIESGTDQSLGDGFNLAVDEVKKFKLIVWLSNFEYNQDDEDGGGNYSALVTYTSTNGSRITGTFSANG